MVVGALIICNQNMGLIFISKVFHITLELKNLSDLISDGALGGDARN